MSIVPILKTTAVLFGWIALALLAIAAAWCAFWIVVGLIGKSLKKRYGGKVVIKD